MSFISRPNLRALAISGLLLALNAGHAHAQAESLLGSFDLVGTIRLGTSDCAGGSLRELRAAGRTPSILFVDQQVATTGLQTSVSYGLSAGDQSLPYWALLQRDVNGSAVTWRVRNQEDLGTAPRFFYGGSATPGRSREFRYDHGNVVSPLDLGIDVVQHDVDLTDLVSVTFELETPWASTTDDVVALRVVSTASGTPTAQGWFNSTACYGAGLHAGTTPCLTLGGADSAKTVNGFIREYVTDAFGTTIAQRIRAELMVIPDRVQTVSILAELRDGVVLTSTQAIPAYTSCSEVQLSATDSLTCPACVIARAPQEIRGTVFFEPTGFDAAVGGPRPTAYYVTFFEDAATPFRTGFNAGGGLLAFSDTTPTTPLDYQWRGLPPGRYRLDNTNSGGPEYFVEWGHVVLGWGSVGTPGYRPPTPFGSGLQGTYRFPRGGASTDVFTVDGAGRSHAGMDASGHFYVDALESQTVNRYAEMAYIRGRVDFVGGCALTPAILASGSAEFNGVGTSTGTSFTDEGFLGGAGITRASVTDNFDAFARGLFRAGSHPDAGEFEVAASTGPWEEKAYRLQLIDGQGYSGTLSVWPANPRQLTINGPGRSNENTDFIANPLSLPVTRYTVLVRVPAGQLLRNPTVQIGRDVILGGAFQRVPYTDLNGVAQGTYVASSAGIVSADPTRAFVDIIALADSNVDIFPSAEVSTDGGLSWSIETGFPPIDGVQLSGSCGTCLIDATTQIVDTDGGPDIVVTPLPEQPLGTTQVTLTGTVSDGTPVREFTIDGQPATLSDTGTFSFPVSGLLPGDNIVIISATDCVGNITPMQVIIRVAQPLCPPENTPAMCLDGPSGAPATGSVFYVDVVRTSDDAVCQLRCEIAAPGAALTCDSTPVCPN